MAVVLADGAAKGLISMANTIAAYNEGCAAGKDAFDKPAEYLKAYNAEGPYYAVQFVPSYLGSMDGVVTDYNGRVQDVNGNVIEGVYAAGEMSNRMFYNQVYVGVASLSLYPISAQMAVADMLAK